MKVLKEENGFTLIEMLIVLLVISILMLIAIPNVTKNSKSIDEKGCDAYVLMVQGQVEAYKMDKGGYPDGLQELVAEKYITETPKCPDGTEISISNGKVDKAGTGS